MMADHMLLICTIAWLPLLGFTTTFITCSAEKLFTGTLRVVWKQGKVKLKYIQ